MSKKRAKVSYDTEKKEKNSLTVVIVAAVLAVLILAGATIGVLFATGVFSSNPEESSSSSEQLSHVGEDNEINIGDLLEGLK